MRKETIAYTRPLDALVAVAKRLSLYEHQHHMVSESFFDRYSKGQMPDDQAYIEWANDYRHYLDLRHELEKSLYHVA